MPGATPLRESARRVSKTEGFLRFFNFWSNPLRESGCRVSKTEVFLRVLVCPVHPSQGKRGSSVKNWGFFAFLVCPKVSWELCWRFVLPHTAVFSREQKWAKIAKKRQKLMVFCDFFMFEATLCGNPAVECQKLVFFSDFGVPESVLTIRFALYGLFQTLSQGEKRWFQTSLKPVWNRADGFRLVSEVLKPRGFRGFETHLFFLTKAPKRPVFLSTAIPSRPVMVSEGSETVWFQRGFRVVETVWFQRGFRVVWNRVVSEGFQSGLKACGFRGVSEGSEWFWTKTFENLLRRLNKKKSLERRRNKFSKVFVQNHPMKNHTKFLLGNRPYEALKKTFWKNCYFSFKKFIGRSPKEFKEVFGQHPNKKSYQFLLGKSLQKETLKKQFGRTAWFAKKILIGETSQ